MIRDRAEGRHVDRRVEAAAANEDFTAVVRAQEAAASARGWDPFEVWRTRVKRMPSKSARAAKDHAHDAPR